MSNLEAIKEHLDAGGAFTPGPDGDLERLDRACVIWKSAADARRSEIEVSNSERSLRSESSRFWFSVLAPTVSAVALVATLIFQIVQFKDSSQRTRDAEEDVQWREMIKTLAARDAMSSIAAVLNLKSFFASERLRTSARQYALQLMGIRGAVLGLDPFEILLPPVMSSTDWSNYREVIDASARMQETYAYLDGELKGASKESTGDSLRGNEFSPSVTRYSELARNDKRDAMERDRRILSNEITQFGTGIVSLLRAKRPSGTIPRLNGLAFWESDLRDVDFAEASLESLWVWSCDLQGVDLGGIKAFNKSIWQETAWWKAKRVAPELLEYLAREYPFSPSVGYGEETATAAEYESNLARLRREGR
jgi:hypothetical protein